MRGQAWGIKKRRRDFRSGRVPFAKAGSLFCLFFSASLLAAALGGTIRGTVKTDAGVPVARATVVARASDGRTLASVLTDRRGRFQFPPIQPGICRVEVQCPGCGKIAAQTLVIENEGNLNVNFVVRRQSEGQTARSDLLGPVSLYTNPDYKTSGLEDPSAGGGYSDSASRQAGKMVSQYLGRDTAPSPGRSAHEGNLMDAPSLSEASLEGTGRALLAKAKFTQAIPVFETAVARYPRSERLRMGLGLSLYGAGKFPAAGQTLREAARLAPDDPSPILLLAEASRFAPNFKTSRLLKRFSDLHPQSGAGHYAYGLALWGDYRSRHDARVLAQAQRQFEKALALDGNYSDAHLHLGMVYDEQGATQRAIHEYLKTIAVSPALAIARYRLAQDYERVGERDKAAAEIARYEKLRGHASQ